MSLDHLKEYSQKELDQFKLVCNQLLSRTFIIKSFYRPEKGWINNPDYYFLVSHYEDVRDYLQLLDWQLNKDDLNGYFYVLNTDDANRANLNKTATAILLALRMIYDESQERLGLEHDAVITVRDLLEKVVTDYAILSTRPNMDEVKRALTILENHSVILRIQGRLNSPACKFAILPTILTVVSSEKLNTIVSVLKKEEDALEEIEEDPAD